MVLSDENKYVFLVFEKIFDVITWGWVAEILLGILIFMGLLYILFFLIHFRIIRYLMLDKLFFVSTYFYYFTLEKKYFIRSFVGAIYREFKRNWRIYTIFIIAGILIIGLCIGIVYYIVKTNT